MGCLNCGNEIVQPVGKAKKLYCNSTCRSNHFQRKKKLGGDPTSFAKKRKPSVKGFVKKPSNEMTIEKIKAMCPSNLTGLARSAWIFDERQKYGI